MLPYSLSGPTSANIIGIDPGSTTLGLSVLSFDIRTGQIVGAAAQTLWGVEGNYHQWNEETLGARWCRIQSLSQRLYQCFCDYQPLLVASEAPFINMRRPQAYGVLVETIGGIKTALSHYDPLKPLYRIDPSTVKKTVGAKSGGDKANVKTAMLELHAVRNVFDGSLEMCDEHSLDALAVGYTAYSRLIGNNINSLALF